MPGSFEAFEEFFAKISSSVLRFFSCLFCSQVSLIFSLDWKWQELVFIDLLSFAWNSFIYDKACSLYLFA